MKKILILCLILISVSCTKFNSVQQGVKNSEVTQLIPINHKIINVTWKDAGLWVLTRKRKPGETIDTLQFICYDGINDTEVPSSILNLIEQ